MPKRPASDQDASPAKRRKADKPKADKPKADKPKADKPKGDKPRADKGKAGKPRSDKPKADKPKGDKPKADKPKADKPRADKGKGDKGDKGKGEKSGFIDELKALWEKARQKTTSAQDRTKMLRRCMELMDGKVEQVVFKHDTGRVVQFCLKFGDSKQRSTIHKELKARFGDLCMSKYGKFLACKLIRYGSKAERTELLKDWEGKVRKMMRHKEAAYVVEFAFSNVATETQRATMLQELYNPAFRIVDMKVPNKHALKDVLAKRPSVSADSCIAYMRDLLNVVLDKALATHTIIQKLLLEFLSNAPEADVKAMVPSVVGDVVRMMHTKEGARVGVRCVTEGSAKERKQIVKSLKGVVGKACQADFGYQVILRIFEVVDDTSLVSKVIVSEMCDSLSDIVYDAGACKCVLFLLCPTSGKHFPPQLLAELRAQVGGGDVSKKDPAVRRRELLSALLPSLLEYATEDVYGMLTSPVATQVLLALLTNVEAEHFDDALVERRDQLIEAICDMARWDYELVLPVDEAEDGDNAEAMRDEDDGEADKDNEKEGDDDDDEDDESEAELQPKGKKGKQRAQQKRGGDQGGEAGEESEFVRLVDHPVAHRTLRWLATAVPESKASEGTMEVRHSNGTSFASLLWDALRPDIAAVVASRGVFVLVTLLQCPDLADQVFEAVKEHKGAISNQALLQELAKRADD